MGGGKWKDASSLRAMLFPGARFGSGTTVEACEEVQA